MTTPAWRSALARVPAWTLRVATGGGLLFLGLAALVALGATRGTDLAVTLALQSLASDPLDVLVNWHTLIGQLAVTIPLAAVLAVAVWRRHGGWAWLAPLAILATGAIELAFKYGLVHPGPPDEFIRAFINPLGVRIEAPSSFPSGHMARLTFLAVLLAGLFPSRPAWLAAASFVAVALFARVYIGDHWISDALGGLTLGAAVGAAALAWLHATRAR